MTTNKGSISTWHTKKGSSHANKGSIARDTPTKGRSQDCRLIKGRSQGAHQQRVKQRVDLNDFHKKVKGLRGKFGELWNQM
eukprot:5978773-Pleurochrysis_carterae.AAC.1